MLDFSVTFFITIINVLVLFVILRALLFKPLTRFMRERSAKIKEDIEGAEKDKREAKLLLEQYEKRLASAEERAGEILRGAREQAEKEAERIKLEAALEAERIIAAGRSQLELEKAGAMAVFRAEAASLVARAAALFLKREMREVDSLKFAREALNDLALPGGETDV
ncbi:MAG: ATP synthase F0 subunit B [Treponema sp.]|jgi:F-type H+-transporting ATPase subunit b|nr:ATP synthase F0 subunit B [Treponema sp.]